MAGPVAAVGMDKAKFAVIGMDNLNSDLEWRMAGRAFNDPLARGAWTDLESAWNTPSSGDFATNTGEVDLSGLSLGSNHWMELAPAVRKGSGGDAVHVLRDPRNQVHLIVGATFPFGVDVGAMVAERARRERGARALEERAVRAFGAWSGGYPLLRPFLGSGRSRHGGRVTNCHACAPEGNVAHPPPPGWSEFSAGVAVAALSGFVPFSTFDGGFFGEMAGRALAGCEDDYWIDGGMLPDEYSDYDPSALYWGEVRSYASGCAWLVVGSCREFNFCDPDDPAYVKIVLGWEINIFRARALNGALERVCALAVHSESWIPNESMATGPKRVDTAYAYEITAGAPSSASLGYLGWSIGPRWESAEVATCEAVSTRVLRGLVGALSTFRAWDRLVPDVDGSARYAGPLAANIAHALYLLEDSELVARCADPVRGICNVLPLQREADGGVILPEDDDTATYQEA